MSKKKRRTAAETELDPLAEMLDGLWAALAAGDLLQAELETARCCSIPYQLGIYQDESDAIFIGMAKQGGRPEDAALLRLIMLIGSPGVKRQARTALGELTAKGVYPASWVAEAGKAEPVRAVRVADRFGDSETIFVTYRYSSGEHTLQFLVDLTYLPVVRRLALTEGTPEAAGDTPFETVEEVSLADARTRLEDALTTTESTVTSLNPEFAALMPIARARLRRLPAGESAGEGTDEAKPYTGDDRAALVREFLASPYAARTVADDEASTRFWAEILTAWSGRAASGPPLQAGPRSLWHLLNDYVPFTYPVTPEQRQHLAPAVTAWARWSAAKRGLDEEHMLTGLPAALSAFPDKYDDAESRAERAYLADVATSDADLTGLRDILTGRTIVIPLPEDRVAAGKGPDLLDATDPAVRAAYLTAEFGDCELSSGQSRDDFLGVLRQVGEELWHGTPENTREQALVLLTEDGLDRHDVMHELVRHALSRRVGQVAD